MMMAMPVIFRLEAGYDITNSIKKIGVNVGFFKSSKPMPSLLPLFVPTHNSLAVRRWVSSGSHVYHWTIAEVHVPPVESAIFMASMPSSKRVQSRQPQMKL